MYALAVHQPDLEAFGGDYFSSSVADIYRGTAKTLRGVGIDQRLAAAIEVHGEDLVWAAGFRRPRGAVECDYSAVSAEDGGAAKIGPIVGQRRQLVIGDS